MKKNETDRKFWNKQQSEFRQVLLSFEQHDKAIQMFLSQHAILHSRKVAQSEGRNSELRYFEDELLDDMTEQQIRRLFQDGEHSIAWNVWHMARIEDVTMNMLVAGESQILEQDDWLERMKIAARDTGNTMDETGIIDLSNKINIEALRAYRVTVGKKTREIVKQLRPEDIKQMVDPDRLQRVMDEGAVLATASDLIAYWSRRNIAGLLLMPATRHNFVHLNETFRLKEQVQ